MNLQCNIDKLTDEQLVNSAAQRLTPKEKAIPFLREMLREFGRDKFCLWYGIREPHNQAEVLEMKLRRDEISVEDYKAEIRQYCTRPVDSDMLSDFENDVQTNLENYSGFLQAVIGAARKCERERDIFAGESDERSAENHCESLHGKSEMFYDELMSCGSFLEEMNAKEGKGVITAKEFTGISAYWIAMQVFDRAKQGWMSCKEVAIDSQRGFEYTHATAACLQFRDVFLETLPAPQYLHTLVSEELSRARLRLQNFQEEESRISEGKQRLSEQEYEKILDIMQNMALVMERSPSAFKTMDEEMLRTHFLVQLNGHWPGQATGETFNYKGKTDILIRSCGENIFIAECKFWAGQKALADTIDQLLGYSSWRDTKLAIVLFSRNRDFTNVLTTADATTKQHSNFVRDLGKQTETSFRYTFSHKDDSDRELTLTVMAFSMPS